MTVITIIDTLQARLYLFFHKNTKKQEKEADTNFFLLS